MRAGQQMTLAWTEGFMLVGKNTLFIYFFGFSSLTFLWVFDKNLREFYRVHVVSILISFSCQNSCNPPLLFKMCLLGIK